MITVLAAVICGVTFSVSAASLNDTVTVLFDDRLNRNLHALRHLGGDVVLRRHPRRRQDAAVAGGFERRQRDVEIEGAVDRSEREADRARRRRRGRFTAVGTAPSLRCPALLPPTRPPRLPLFGNARFVVLPSAGSTRPLNPHCTPSARA